MTAILCFFVVFCFLFCFVSVFCVLYSIVLFCFLRVVLFCSVLCRPVLSYAVPSYSSQPPRIRRARKTELVHARESLRAHPPPGSVDARTSLEPAAHLEVLRELVQPPMEPILARHQELDVEQLREVELQQVEEIGLLREGTEGKRQRKEGERGRGDSRRGLRMKIPLSDRRLR